MYSVIFLLVSSMLASNDVGDYMINDILVQWLWWWKHQRGGNYSLEGLGAGVTPTPPPSIMERPLSIHFYLFIHVLCIYTFIILCLLVLEYYGMENLDFAPNLHSAENDV